MAFSNFASSQHAGVTNAEKIRNQFANRPTFSSLAEIEEFGKRPGSTGLIPFKGGFLSGSEFAQVKQFQKEELITDFEAKQATAKSLNEQRYADILSQFGSTIESATARGPELLQFNEANFAGLGDQAKKDISQTFTNLTAQNTQSLVSSGLAGTTARGSVQSNVARGKANALGNLNEQLRRERIGQESEINRFNAATRNAYSQYLDSLTASKLSFMERRDDVGPDQALFLQQLEKFGNV